MESYVAEQADSFTCRTISGREKAPVCEQTAEGMQLSIESSRKSLKVFVKELFHFVQRTSQLFLQVKCVCFQIRGLCAYCQVTSTFNLYGIQ